ncbi:hypothetical protein [Halobaculum sp. P14]|uniref:hypothetical protein n=1 Tax=Halobaculum sp. P14 TaxID=3421638 RepID=UPI003EB6C3F6
MESELRTHLLFVEFLLVVVVAIGVFIYGQLVPQSGVLGLGLLGAVGLLYLYVYDSTE